MKSLARTAVVALAAAALLAGCESTLHGDPDPGGEIMTALKSVEAAVPPDATDLTHEYVEAVWDSCDGRADTEGWSNIQVYLTFRIPGDPEAMVRNADSELSKAGWTSDGPVTTPLGPAQSWTRTLADGTQARASLGNNERSPTDHYWSLIATAPPHGQRVSGC